MNSNPENIPCYICNNTIDNSFLPAFEKMFGMNSEFTYLICAKCGSMQLLNTPTDLSKYYPDSYYSFVAEESSKFKIWMKKKRFQYALTGKGNVGKILVKKFGIPNVANWAKETNLKKDDYILDVGCGSGHLILDMYELGYENVFGVDPFIKNDIIYYNNLHIVKKEICEIKGNYDVIMMHHVFEHLTDPKYALEKLYSNLKKNGSLLIRVPVAGKYAFRKYGCDWVNLDAPRHNYIFSENGMEKLVHQCGYIIEKVIYDSEDFQFWGSELYKMGRPLSGNNKYFFSNDLLRSYKRLAIELNEMNDGDQASFYLRKG